MQKGFEKIGRAEGEAETEDADCRRILIIDPDPSSRLLLRQFALDSGLSQSVLAAACAADIPSDSVTGPVTLVLPSSLGVRDLPLLSPLLLHPATHVVLVLRSLMQDQLDTAQWVLAHAVLRLEDLKETSAREVLTPRSRGTITVSSEAFHQVVRLASGVSGNEAARPRLTEREHETLRAVSQGLSNRRIARRMGITEHGVKRHLANVMSKLNCQNRASAVAVALRSGLLDLDSTDSAAV
ncbi:MULTISPECIES: response regulator transcription factor [unclassified Streptomyces]|uniref:response regulator transcription factor n=1 Tax=unclassified Streptomyces TaxID=2593676 RepID=UPI002255CA4E|nr:MULTISPECIES: LuxR C-terminal-related transcriptional regulator [unclassified Streptomyces]WSP59192.1 LuxR C-terminal-related transcriptional regulator [Streptomyces sp. NBC_01241]WSU20286.1 LuxR C-terminal-related transcriptional regulator [Streptomyces sp. NBC_01108]MCX4790943.1 LuxR C-terminal-related transcriptional regulator [Streptomyces sp. NBC_01221]MCX4793332.1 LuxR C-terminal-related transcriptional regulator [Streptomyces sp. NBC_01242]WSJ34772.1 LuxR C-terminal-related transcrip